MRATRRTSRLAVILLTLAALTQIVHADEKAAAPPALYGFCMDIPAAPDRPVADQAKLLKRLGYDGVGYPLWLGQEMQTNLRTLDDVGLELCLVFTTVNVNPDKPAYDARLPEALAKLKGRPVTVSVLLRGFPPGDELGMESAAKRLRTLGDLAAKNDLRISIYHHLNDWTESLLFSLKVVEKTDHPRVGVNFNLSHWLKVDGRRDYRPVLEKHATRIFAVTINGAQLGSDTWTGGLIQPLDRGDFDNRQLLDTLREIGYTGPVGLMCYGIPDDTEQHLTRSINTWKSWHTR